MTGLGLPDLVSAAVAHEAMTPATALNATGGFDWDLVPEIALALAALAYVVGLVRLRRRGHREPPLRVLGFALGVGLLALPAVSDLHDLGTRLFTAHMLEHEILMGFAPPLLIAARPGAALAWGLPAGLRAVLPGLLVGSGLKALWRRGTMPIVATAVQAIVLYLWHVPVLFNAARTAEGLHLLQHVSFFAAALAYWRAVAPDAAGGAARQGLAVFAQFATAGLTGFLGVLLTVAATPLYGTDAATAAVLGLTPIEDQQLGGLIMWVPAGFVYVGAGLVSAHLWLTRPSHRLFGS